MALPVSCLQGFLLKHYSEVRKQPCKMQETDPNFSGAAGATAFPLCCGLYAHPNIKKNH
jgi:hypothetical protein